MAWTALRHGLRPHQCGRLRQRNLVRIDLQAILCDISSASLFIACQPIAVICPIWRSGVRRRHTAPVIPGVHDAIHKRPTCEKGGHLATPLLRTFLLLRCSKSIMRRLGVEENSGTVLKGCSGMPARLPPAKKWLPAWRQDLLQGATRTRANCRNAHEPLAWQKDDEFKHRRNHVSLSRMQGA